MVLFRWVSASRKSEMNVQWYHRKPVTTLMLKRISRPSVVGNWGSLIVGSDYSWSQLTSFLNYQKNTKTNSVSLKGLCVFAFWSKCIGWNRYCFAALRQRTCSSQGRAASGVPELSWPSWFWFAPSCEVPFPVIQTASFYRHYRICARRVTGGSTPDGLGVVLCLEDVSI